VTVTVKGARYVEDRDTTTIVSGSQAGETTFAEHWTLALNGDDTTPWRLVAAGS
jgi:predicted lipid-binding transport protein (Tim44 family)